MSVTLAADIGAKTQNLRFDGAVGALAGDLFRLGSEVIAFVRYQTPRRPALLDKSRIVVSRGVGRTAPAAHSAGAALRAVSVGLVSSDDEVAVDPFLFTPARNLGQAVLGFSTEIAPGTSAQVPFTLEAGDADLVDLGVSTNPKPVEPGVYAVTAAAHATTSGVTTFIASLRVDDDWHALTIEATSNDRVSISTTWYVDALSPMFLSVYKESGGEPDTYTGALYVQRLS